ncbi:MAG: hypothetical protein LBS36_07440 [Oscillospiraceae bacterium]|jgi:hypothetical protein|nr:hypothetical protein [Oscillospiraceae bacterium]
MKVLYKVVAIVLALAVIPVALFVPFVKLVVTSKAASIFSGSEVLLDKAYSLSGLYESFLKGTEGKEPLDLKAFIAGIPESAKDALGANFIAFLAFFILALLAVIAIVVLVLVCKKKKAILIVTGLGLLFTIGMNIMFNRFAAPLVSGIVPVTDLLSTEVLSQFVGGGLAAIGGLLGSLLGGTKLVEIRLLSLSSAYIFMLILYIASLVWTLAHTLIDWE